MTDVRRQQAEITHREHSNVRDERTKEREFEFRNVAYLRGNEITTDSGPLLSVFALQDILQQVRQNQLEIRKNAMEVSIAPQDITELLERLDQMRKQTCYRILEKVPTFYRLQALESSERIFRIDEFSIGMMRLSGEIDDSRIPSLEDPAPSRDTATVQMMRVLLERINYIREQSNFVLQNVPTYYRDGFQVIAPDQLGIDLTEALSVMTPRMRNEMEMMLREQFVHNDGDPRLYSDRFSVAMPRVVYAVHRMLTDHIINSRREQFRENRQWLERYALVKRILYTDRRLTDIYAPDSLYVCPYQVPANPEVIWEVPRSMVLNLILNIALTVPPGEYVQPSAGIARITISRSITSTSAFSQMESSTPTERQMHDIRKIYLAMMFPNQILLDIEPEPGHTNDPIVVGVAGVVGKLLFSYGPRLFNITPRTARLLDAALAQYLTMSIDDRRVVVRGPTAEPLDFTIGRGNERMNMIDLMRDHADGRGYANWQTDALQIREHIYPHVHRWVCLYGYDAEEVLDERMSGMNHQVPIVTLMQRALRVAGHVAEANYIDGMLQHHVVRGAYLSNIINRDGISAFTPPDAEFNRLADMIPREQTHHGVPIVLGVSYHSIWHAFRLRFLPIARSNYMAIQPLVESAYATQLSVTKYTAQRLRAFMEMHPESFDDRSPMHIWKVLQEIMSEPIKRVFELVGQQFFVNAYDVGRWLEQPALQDSLKLDIERVIWANVDDVSQLMLTRDVYITREAVPQPLLFDPEEARRLAMYYTNVYQGRPRTERVTHWTLQDAEERAARGVFLLELKREIDRGRFVRIGDVLKPITLEITKTKPDRELLEAMPYLYTKHVESDMPMNRFTLRLNRRTRGFVYMYSVNLRSHPDDFVELNDVMCNSRIYVDRVPFERIAVARALDVVNANVESLRKKLVIYDLSETYAVGVRQSEAVTE